MERAIFIDFHAAFVKITGSMGIELKIEGG
jgi:hypothetical protein